MAAGATAAAAALQDLADHLGIPVQVCHFPPGTSKWNKIEHRMFCHITQNWRGRPLVSHEVILDLIAGTATEQGLTIQAELDTGAYPTGIKVSDEELAAVRMEPRLTLPKFPFLEMSLFLISSVTIRRVRRESLLVAAP
jgi:hypothetical protein